MKTILLLIVTIMTTNIIAQNKSNTEENKLYSPQIPQKINLPIPHQEKEENKNDLPQDLQKYKSYNKNDIFLYLTYDTISFCFENYSPSNLNIYAIDTIWIKKIKNKEKAKINKHYKLVKNEKHIKDVDGKQYTIQKVEENSTGLYNRNFYNDIYLCNINNKNEIIIWSYHTNSNYGDTSNPLFEIITTKTAKSAKSFYIDGKYIYLFAGNKINTSNNPKDDFRNYIRVKCIDCTFSINTKYLSPQCTRIYIDDNGKKYALQDFSKDLISPKQYETLKHNNITSQKEEGRYEYILTKIEKYQQTADTHKKYQEIKDNISEYLYEDKNLSILWSGEKEQFTFLLKNKSNNSLKIIWDEASFINNKNQSSKVIHKGVRYINANNPQAPTIIPKGAELNDIIAPVDRIRY